MTAGRYVRYNGDALKDKVGETILISLLLRTNARRMCYSGTVLESTWAEVAFYSTDRRWTEGEARPG